MVVVQETPLRYVRSKRIAGGGGCPSPSRCVALNDAQSPPGRGQMHQGLKVLLRTIAQGHSCRFDRSNASPGETADASCSLRAAVAVAMTNFGAPTIAQMQSDRAQLVAVGCQAIPCLKTQEPVAPTWQPPSQKKKKKEKTNLHRQPAAQALRMERVPARQCFDCVATCILLQANEAFHLLSSLGMSQARHGQRVHHMLRRGILTRALRLLQRALHDRVQLLKADEVVQQLLNDAHVLLPCSPLMHQGVTNRAEDCLRGRRGRVMMVLSHF